MFHLVNVLVMMYNCGESGESVMCTVDLPAWSSAGLSLKYEMDSHQVITVPDYNRIKITSNNPLGVV